MNFQRLKDMLWCKTSKHFKQFFMILSPKVFSLNKNPYPHLKNLNDSEFFEGLPVPFQYCIFRQTDFFKCPSKFQPLEARKF